MNTARRWMFVKIRDASFNFGTSSVDVNARSNSVCPQIVFALTLSEGSRISNQLMVGISVPVGTVGTTAGNMIAVV
jgi:hypothetical protein